LIKVILTELDIERKNGLRKEFLNENCERKIWFIDFVSING
jgi:hypothetical protein